MEDFPYSLVSGEKHIQHFLSPVGAGKNQNRIFGNDVNSLFEIFLIYFLRLRLQYLGEVFLLDVEGNLDGAVTEPRSRSWNMLLVNRVAKKVFLRL